MDRRIDFTDCYVENFNDGFRISINVIDSKKTLYSMGLIDNLNKFPSISFCSLVLNPFELKQKKTSDSLENIFIIINYPDTAQLFVERIIWHLRKNFFSPKIIICTFKLSSFISNLFLQSKINGFFFINTPKDEIFSLCNEVLYRNEGFTPTFQKWVLGSTSRRYKYLLKKLKDDVN